MEMVKVKTIELEGKALDWAVAYHLNGEDVFFKAFGAKMLGRSITKEVFDGNIRPSADWLQGGVIFDTYRIDISHECYPTVFCELTNKEGLYIEPFTGQYGESILIAGMRTIVMAKSGEFVDVPIELLEF